MTDLKKLQNLLWKNLQSGIKKIIKNREKGKSQ